MLVCVCGITANTRWTLEERDTHRVSGISVCVPAFNEEGNIGEVVTKALKIVPKYADELEIIIVDDGSDDRTQQVAKEWAEKDDRVSVWGYAPNRGIGAALRTAFEQVSKPFVFFISSDNQYDFEDLGGFVREIENADVVVGYLPDRADPTARHLLSRSYHLVIQLLFGLRLRNINCIKFFKSEVLEAVELQANGPFIDAELLIKAKNKGFRISEIPVKHYPRAWGKQRGTSLKAIGRTLKELFKLFPQL